MRPADVSDDRFQQSVIQRHVLAVLGFAVKLDAQVMQRLDLTDRRRFKQIQHLSGICTTVADVTGVADIDRIKGVDGTGCFLCISVLAFRWRRKR